VAALLEARPWGRSNVKGPTAMLILLVLVAGLMVVKPQLDARP
jgi:hypothetical protein